MNKEVFRKLRDEFSDEIPNEVLSGKGEFKVRRNWWQALIGFLSQGLKKGSIEPSFKPDIDAFIAEFATDEFKKKKLTEKADIDKANTLLDKILGRK